MSWVILESKPGGGVFFLNRDSTVVTATCYELGDLGIETRWGRDFPHLFRPALGPTQSPIKWVPALFAEGKLAGAWR